MADSGAPVLIVEDERIVARDLQRTLLGFGYDAFAIAASCEEALARAAEKCPAVVLMDIRIKGELDGIATARMLRDRFASVVVYLTANADPETIARATATEPSGYLQKPVRPAELRSAIEISLHKRKAEARWRDGERWIESALDAIEDAVIAVEPGGTILELNPIVAGWLGKSADELRGVAVSDALRLLEPSTRDTLAEPTAPVLADGRVQRGRARIVSPDGSERVVRYRAQPVLAPGGGRVLGALLVMNELARDLQQIAADAPREFRALVERAPVGIFVHQQGKFVYVNNAFLSALGYERAEELLGRPVLETVDPAARNEVVERMRRLGHGKPSAPAEVRSLRRDGSIAYLEGTGFPLEFEGAPATVVVMQDITARHAVDVALLENEARYRHLFNDSPIALWETDFSLVRSDLDGFAQQGIDVVAHLRACPELAQFAAENARILNVNEAALALFRADSRAELLKSLRPVFEPEGYAVLLEGLCFLWSGQGRKFAAETWTRTLNGERREIDVRLSLMPGSEETWKRVVLSLFDTTAFKAAERELRASLLEKDVLLKEVHHRVKNNLQVISSLLSLQAMQLLDPGIRQRLLESQNRVQAIALVHEKLYRSEKLSHIAFGEYAEALVAELAQTHSAAANGIKLSLDMGDVHIGVDAAIPLGLMLNELVSNALKHAFVGSPSGLVEVRLTAADGRLTLSVADDGIGLPPGLDPRNASTLGLDLVFTFAEQLEAEVEIETGAGTRFSISFAEK
ncbi:MAG TPA: PAS domain S-box protein [Polyangiales bacterium]|nr:PAS domain S-box protein [Polyangiales bacterium]